MDYKKKYEEAMLRMNKWVEGSEITDPKEVAEFVFPELKESEDDIMRKMAIHAVYSPEAQSCIKSWGINPSDVIAWLEKQGEQNPAWSEEDEKLIEEVADSLRKYSNYVQDGNSKVYILSLADSIKSLQPRCTSLTNDKPKQEWSEEDKGNLLDIKCIIDEVWHNQDVREEIDHSSEELESLWHWLDNVWQKVEYPQSTWKPSNEQMDALNIFIGEANSYDTAAGYEEAEILSSLYEQLKKLKGE